MRLWLMYAVILVLLGIAVMGGPRCERGSPAGPTVGHHLKIWGC